MGYQVPRVDHPWRTWVGESSKARVKPTKPSLKKEAGNLKPIKVFLEEIVSSWSEVEVVTSAYGREGRYHLTDLPQERIAAWLSGLLRRNYGTN